MPTQPQDYKKPSSAKEWKKKTGKIETDLELPSGFVARVRRIPMPKLLSSGLFSDSLQGIVNEQISDKSSKTVDENVLRGAMNDPAQMEELFRSFDRILVMAVVEPPVEPSERKNDKGEWEIIPESERDEDLLYADEVDLEDKSFIFQFCVGGTRDLEDFRKESNAAMDNLENVPVVQDSAE